MQTFEIRSHHQPLPPIAIGVVNDEGDCSVFFYGEWRDAPSPEIAAEWIAPTSVSGVEVVWT